LTYNRVTCERISPSPTHESFALRKIIGIER